MDIRKLIIHSFLVTLSVIVVECYEVPPALVEPLSPVGLRVSIPDHEGVTLFAFHGKINVDFEHGREAGEEGLNTDVLRKRNGMWVFTNRSKRLKINDVIYYWLYVIKDGLGYERLFQSHTVTEFFPDTQTPGTVTSGPPVEPFRPNLPPVIPSKPCDESITLVNNKHKCKGEVLLDIDFSRGWSNKLEPTIQVSDIDEEFVVYNENSENIFLSDNSLTIKPTLVQDSRFIKNGKINFSGSNKCTNSNEKYCIREASGPNFLPPINSGRLSTKTSFSFCYGVVEVRAKLPLGDWVVPELWLVPKVGDFSEKNPVKIIIASAFGNAQLTSKNSEIGNRHLFSGMQVDQKVVSYNVDNAKRLFSEDFHNYKIIWKPDFIGFYIDSRPIGQWKDSDINIEAFNKEFYLVLGLHVGGTLVFPDGAVSNGHRKPWNNTDGHPIRNFYSAKDEWFPTWNSDTKLQIQHVKVWAI